MITNEQAGQAAYTLMGIAARLHTCVLHGEKLLAIYPENTWLPAYIEQRRKQAEAHEEAAMCLEAFHG